MRLVDRILSGRGRGHTGKYAKFTGEHVVMTCFVDADHAGCKETRGLHSGILMFVNRTPILWYSKRQNS
jgi:hypothetical protein